MPSWGKQEPGHSLSSLGMPYPYLTNALCVICGRCGVVCGVDVEQGFPTIKFFYVSNGKIKSSTYQGGRSAKELVTFAIDKVGRLSRLTMQQHAMPCILACLQLGLFPASNAWLDLWWMHHLVDWCFACLSCSGSAA